MVTIEDGMQHLAEIAELFEEYKAYIAVDVSFQPADQSEAEIEKRYGGDGGRLYIAFVDGKAAGCIAFHAMQNGRDCEFKRFFTRPEFRGQHVGRALFERALEGALDGLIGMREQEGERMCEDILEKIGNIERLRDGIAERAPLVVCEYRDKLQQRIAALTEGEIDEARLMTEVAIFADRAAIDEELVRLKSHAAAIRETAALAEPVGRKLDFLVQELNREVNTIGSKASDTAIAQAVVSAKGEIEKLREQVQNVE